MKLRKLNKCCPPVVFPRFFFPQAFEGQLAAVVQREGIRYAVHAGKPDPGSASNHLKCRSWIGNGSVPFISPVFGSRIFLQTILAFKLCEI